MPAEPVSSDQRKNPGMTVSRPTNLPMERDLTLAYALSLLIALLMAAAALTGLFFPTTIYPAEELILAFAPVDLFHLVVGLPVLLGSMWLTRRRKLIGLLCWPGALLYVLYSYVLNLIGVPFGALFLPYLLLATLSAYATIFIVANIDGQAVRQLLTGRVPAKPAGGVLAVLSGLFIVFAVVDIISALLSQRPVGQLDLMLWIADLSTIGPACLVGGILLYQRRALGYALGAGLLLALAMLFIGLVPVMLFPAIYSASSIDVTAMVAMLALGLICLIPFTLFARGVLRPRSPFGDQRR